VRNPIGIPDVHSSGSHALLYGCSFAWLSSFLSYSIEQIELQAKLLNYFLGSNKSNINHVRLPHGIGGCELVDIHELEGSPCWCPCLGDGETAIYFPTNVWFH